MFRIPVTQIYKSGQSAVNCIGAQCFTRTVVTRTASYVSNAALAAGMTVARMYEMYKSVFRLQRKV